MIRNKKAQVGQTMTWVVATIIILVIMMIFIFLVGSGKFEKALGISPSIPDNQFYRSNLQQTLYTILNTQVDGKLISDSVIEAWEKDVATVGGSTDFYDPLEAKINPIMKKLSDNGLYCDFVASYGISVRPFTPATEIRFQTGYKKQLKQGYTFNLKSETSASGGIKWLSVSLYCGE